MKKQLIGILGASVIFGSTLTGVTGVDVGTKQIEAKAKTVTKKAVAPAIINKGELRLKDRANITASYMAEVKKYYGSTKITKVTVGKQSTIATNLFKYLPSNVPVTVSAGTVVKKNVFKGATITNDLTLQDVKTIEEGAFRDTTFTKNFRLIGNNTVIGKYAFMGAKLPNVSIEGSIKQIQEQAFRDTVFQQGQGIAIQATIGEIGKYAFSTVKPVGKLVFNKNVGTVKAYGLASINTGAIEFSGDVKQLDADFLANSTHKEFKVYKNIGLVKKNALRGQNMNQAYYDIKGNITKIEDYGLSYVRTQSQPQVKFSKINIEGNIGEAGRASFNGKYDQIRIGGRITKLGDYAFGFSYGNVEVVKGVENIGAFVLYNDGSRGTITLPKNFLKDTKTIANNAFAHSHIGGEVILPPSLTKMGTYAFYNNKIESVVDKSALKAIPIGAFDTNAIKKIELKSTIQTISERAFNNHQMSRLVLPRNTTIIGKNAFTSTQNFVVEGRAIQKKLFNGYSNVTYQVVN